MTQHSVKYFVNKGFLKYLDELSVQGLTEQEIADHLFKGQDVRPSISALRQIKSIVKYEIREEKTLMIEARRAMGYSISKIANELHMAESTVRGIIKREESK